MYPIGEPLRAYLSQYTREHPLPIQYADLLRYDNSAALFDKRDRDTLWETVYYQPAKPTTFRWPLWRSLEMVAVH